MRIKSKILDTTKGIKFIRIRDITKRLKFTKKLIWVKALGWLLSIGLMYWIFFVKLPSQISISEVMATLSAMSSLENILLLLGGLLTIVVYGWTSATVLPGLSVNKGTQSAVVGQLTSVALPVPLDMAIRFSMYKTYGFGIDESGIAVGIAGLARYFTVVAMPILGLLAVILAGDATATTFTWFLVLGVIFVVALLVIRAILASKKSARHVGDIIERIVNRLRRRFKHKPLSNVSDNVVNFGARTSDVAVKHFKSIAISNIAWGFSCYLVFLMAVRFCGIGSDVFSASFLLLVTGSMLLLNSIPITPGGIGVTEAVLLSVISFPNPEVQTTFTAALFVYRIYTWLLPLPVGVVAYLTWRIQVRRSHKLAHAKIHKSS